MEDELIASDGLSLRRKSLLPGTGFFYPDSLDEDRADERVREAVADAEVVVVADTDADGLGSVALIRAAYDAALDPDPFLEKLEARLESDDEGEIEPDDPETPDAEDVVESPLADPEAEDDLPSSSVAVVGAGPHNIEDALERVAEFAPEGIDLYVCDLCPDRYEYVEDELAAAVETAGSVRWFDHHQWGDAVAESVREAGVDLVVGESDEECTADVTLRSMEYDFPEHLAELAAVTRDHDLWLKEDPRSDDVADFAYWTDPETYVSVVGVAGPDLPPVVERYLAHRREEKEQLIEKAVGRAETHEVGPWTVGVTYGRCSQNEVAEAMRERGCDAAVIVKPAGSASIRGTETFERAHEVAGQVNGGGHPKAAGCKPDIYDDMLDYAHHWTTEGATTKRVILAAFERVAERAAEEDEAATVEAEGDAEETADETAAVSEEETPDAGPDGDAGADHVVTGTDEDDEDGA
ncbi:DHH family phosphoesterase [Halobium salinum]|uniref:DHH family phosphoesterase n=1 Tax=Halobium salinum TaxID=1364940 RepID=A0ABD5PB38_9EURY|nr:phosphohydrolase [Halobium salinum]